VAAAEYRVEIPPAVERQIRSLPRQAQERVVPALLALGSNPRPPGVKKLAGREQQYRIRIGTYRAIYEIHDRSLIVLVVRVGQRGSVYR
jgi:mRNA interferase RelE/StbE